MDNTLKEKLHYNIEHAPEFYYCNEKEITTMENIILNELNCLDFDPQSELSVRDQLEEIDFNLYEPCITGLPSTCYNMSREMEQNVFELIRDNLHSSRHYSLKEYIAKAYAMELEHIVEDTLQQATNEYDQENDYTM